MKRELIEIALADVERKRAAEEISDALMEIATFAAETDDIDEAIACLAVLRTAVKSRHLLLREAEGIGSTLGLTMKHAELLAEPDRNRLASAADSVLAWLFHTVYLSFGEKSVAAITQSTIKSHLCT